MALLIAVWQFYLSAGPLNIKFVDPSVVLFVIALAGPISTFKTDTLVKKIWVFLAALGPMLAYLALGSIYPSFVLFISCLAMMIVSEATKKFIYGYAASGALMIAAFINKNQFISGDAFNQLLESEKHTDFIFSFLNSSSSAVRAFVAAISICIVTHLVSTIGLVKSVYGKTMTTGAAATLGIGICWGMLSGLGFIPMPITGVNFPFLSYGGSLLVAHLALVGIAIGIKRRKNITPMEV